MRFAITALGSAGGRTVGQVVDDIVRYLEPRSPDHPSSSPSVPSGEGPSSYYADRGSEPGRWLGHGAREAALVGEVAPQDFGRVLAGRDPRTGSRLITAQGSAGRRPTLGAGCETRRGPDGELLYGPADVAAALGIAQPEAEALLAAGQRLAIGALAGHPVSEPAASYLVPIVESDGSVWVTAGELERNSLARERGPVAAEVASTGDPEDLLTVAEAARLSGLTTQYLRSLCRRWEQHRDEIDAALASGRAPKRAYVVAWRGVKGKWLVKRGDLVAFLERRAAPAVRVGYDLTLTTEKSLGVLALLGDDHTRAAVLAAIQTGNDIGIAYLELHATAARRRGEQVLGRGLTVASFRHLTSRALDPFPHHHNVVANTVIDEHGSRRALDARGLYRHAQAASALATAEMRHQLTVSLGVTWRPSRSGGWEIDGISEAVVREFSRRRNEIDDAVAELEEAIGRTKTVDELQSIVLATRPAKEDVDPRQLVAGWWERAARHGLTPEALGLCTGRTAPPHALDRDAIFDRLASPDAGVCSGASLFTRADVLAVLVDLPIPTSVGVQPLILRAAEMEHLADEFLASSHAVRLEAPEQTRRASQGAEAIYTTREMFAVQQRVLDRFEQGRASGTAQVSEACVARAIAEASRLSAEQVALVEAFCISGDAVQCAIGRAGAGKTTSMRAAARAWHAEGYRVVGAAVKGEATRHLAEGAGIPAETVAWFLARRDAPVLPIDENTVLIVDEASTLSDRDLDALIDLAQRAGSAIRLIGDPYQHGAVAAGGMFRVLCELHPDTPDLATSHRVTDPSDRQAALALRAGRPEEALAILEAAGHLHVAESEIGLYVGMLHRWWQGHQHGEAHPMVDRRHHTRRQLNRLARHLLRTHGELGEVEIAASGDRRFAAGDRVVARMAARHLHVPGDTGRYVRNGAQGTVIDVVADARCTDDTLRIDFEGIGVIDVPRAFFDEHAGPGGRRDVGIDHAYAVTSYGVQGATYEASTSRIDEGATRAETYVDITRGRRSNHLFVTRAPHPLDGEHLPEAPPPPIIDSVADRLRRSGPERAAIEHALAAGQPPALLTVPPAEWTDRFPEPGGGPVHLRRRWRAALDAVSAYRSRWHPPPGRSEWEWAVGSPIADPAARAEREAVMDALHAYSFAVVRESFDAGTETFPAVAEQLIGAMRLGADRTTVEQLTRICRQFVEHHASDDGSAPGPNDIEAALAREVAPLISQRPSLARPGIERT